MIATPGQTVYAAVDPSSAPLSGPVPVLSLFQNGQCTNVSTNFFRGSGGGWPVGDRYLGRDSGLSQA